MTVEITDDTLEKILQSNPKVIIKFYADWCGICKAFAPQFDKMGETYAGDIKFFSINAPDNPKARLSAGVYSLPFFATYEDGQLKEKLSSAEKAKIDEMLLNLKNSSN